MCIICDIKTKGEQIHREIEASFAAQDYNIDLEMGKAQLNLDNALAVSKLVGAAESLFELGENDRASRVLLALDAILPVRKERRSATVGQTGEAAGPTVPDSGNSAEQVNAAAKVANNPLDVGDEIPASLRGLVDGLRGMGFSVRLG